jgi:septal ring factor EnvC (AmiA/AmiB activator)
LIIQHEDGYHTLLSGFSRIDCAVGSRVLAGEPVGAMGDETDERPVLYVELRLNGRPINPLPWLTAGTSKVSG